MQPGGCVLRIYKTERAGNNDLIQEIRNIVWLAEMISRHLPKNHQGWRKIIIPFSHLLEWLKFKLIRYIKSFDERGSSFFLLFFARPLDLIFTTASFVTQLEGY